MEDKKEKKQNEILSLQEYLARRKEKQSIDPNGAECYDT